MENDGNADLTSSIREARDDPRTVEELVSLALSEQDENAAWDVVSILHLRGTHEVFDAARSLCQSCCDAEQTLGVNILGQLGVPDHSFPDESVEACNADQFPDLSISIRSTDSAAACSWDSCSV